MQRSVRVLFDGEVLRPEEPLDLEPNRCYEVTIEPSDPAARPDADERPLRRYIALAQDLGVPDLAEQHDHYLYGTPKG